MARKKNKLQFFENIEIIDAAAKGVSVAKAPDGKVIFVSNAVPGDVVSIKTINKKKSYYEGVITSITQPSRDRIEPVCSHFGYCGGCKWQNMSYEKQLYFKSNEVYNNLKRIGKLNLPDIEPILGSKKTFYYRNKMEFAFSETKWLTPEEIANENTLDKKFALGFHIPKMWDKILNIEKCFLQEDPSNEIRNSIRLFAVENNISFYNPKTQNGLLRTLMIRTSSVGEIMVLIQFFEDKKLEIELILNFIKTKFSNITSLLYVINKKANDTLYDQEINVFHGKNHILEKMEDLYFSINAKSFYQTNSEQAFELYKITREFANLNGNELVFDLYTGTGTIALFISKFAKKIIGIEAVSEAIIEAKENAKRNNISNCDFYVGDMKNIFNDAFIAQQGKPDVIITDPPRDGMHKDVVEQLKKIGAKKIVYVSCNSATQARDLALLDDIYEVKRVKPVDMFPQTHHVENVILLEKRNE